MEYILHTFDDYTTNTTPIQIIFFLSISGMKLNVSRVLWNIQNNHHLDYYYGKKFEMLI